MSWFAKLVSTVAATAAKVGTQALIQTSGGQVTLDAFAKAGEMVLKARAGDAAQQAKVATVAALADTGDPAAKQGAALLQLVNDLVKRQEQKAAPTALGCETPINAELDVGSGVETYDWGW
jgi:hypothetical protein